MIYKKGQLPITEPFERAKLRRFDTDILRYLNEQDENLAAIFENGIRFDENFEGDLVSVASHATPGTEFLVAHELGKVPSGYIVYGQTGAGSVYDGTTTNTTTTLYLRSDASAVTFRVLVF